MSHENRFVNALSSPDPGQALRSLAVELGSEGNSRQQVYDLFERFLESFRNRQDHDEKAEDFILETMDALSGWCHKDAELLADK